MRLSPNAEKQESDARRINRMPINLPVKVEGLDTPESGWEEITRLHDVSTFGAGFTLSRPVKRGRLIRLTLPLPRQMRSYDYFDSQYKTWAIVRRCVSKNEKDVERYFLGVGFIGKVPPKSFIDDPSRIFDITQKSESEGIWEISEAAPNADESELPKEDRRHSRYDIPVELTLELLSANGKVVQSEQTFSENISLGGASLFTTLEVEKGAFVRVSSTQYKTCIKAIVRGRHLGPDGIPRLHIEFIDQFFPLSGILS